VRSEKKIIIRDLGDGLVLRRGRRADADALAELNAEIHLENEPDLTPESMKSWTRDLMSGGHPTFDPSDVTIVEDTNTGAIVSSISLIPQPWSYEGVRLKAGLPELVGTRPDYRRRGLIRAQFEIIHRWSARRGHRAQAIGGIPNFYRQFG
jgi:GNAT superfamily N-acetyltransferase